MSEPEEKLWRALSSPWRRQLLDLLRAGPRSTGELVQAMPDLSRFAVMQHLDVLAGVDLVVVRRQGRHRFNHLNPVPLRRWYERWVVPLADESAGQLLALQRHVETTGANAMTFLEQVRTVRIETQLHFNAPPERVFAALTGDTTSWFPHSYGGERTRRVVMEPRVGGSHYEDWGDGAGYLYGQVTQWAPPHAVSLRGRVGPGVLLDTSYEITAQEQGQTLLRMSKVATGPMTEEEAGGIRRFGDIANFTDELRKVIES